MAENTIKSRVQLKNDTEANWDKAVNFIPKPGELIIYSTDNAHPFCRIKVGDGSTTAPNLPFIDAGTLNGITATNITAKQLQHTLTFGSSGTYSFDGSNDITIPFDASDLETGTVPPERLPIATPTSIGGVKISSTTGSTSQTYNVALDSSGVAYVGVPWANTKVNMRQVGATVSSAFPILLKPNTTTAATTNTVYFASGITYNPALKTLSLGATGSTIEAATFLGTATTADLSMRAQAADITAIPGGLAFFTNTTGAFSSTSRGSANEVLISSGTSTGPTWDKVSGSNIKDSTITTAHLAAPTITMGEQSVTLGGSVQLQQLLIDLGVNSVLKFRGIVSNSNLLPSSGNLDGDVYFVNNTASTEDTGTYVYSSTATPSPWVRMGDQSVAYKVNQQVVNNPSILNNATSTTFISGITQNINGDISPVAASVPTATTANIGLMQVGSGLTVNDGTVSVTQSTYLPETMHTVAYCGTSSIPSRQDHRHPYAHKCIVTTISAASWNAPAQSNAPYTFTIQDSFITTAPVTDIQLNVVENLANLLAPLYANTDTVGQVKLSTQVVPTGAIKVKISLDKSL